MRWRVAQWLHALARRIQPAPARMTVVYGTPITTTTAAHCVADITYTRMEG